MLHALHVRSEPSFRAAYLRTEVFPIFDLSFPNVGIGFPKVRQPTLGNVLQRE
jgi:hypothetical protein